MIRFALLTLIILGGAVVALQSLETRYAMEDRV